MSASPWSALRFRCHALALMLAGSALLACSDLPAQQPDEQARLTPFQCEAWATRARALAGSDDPLERELGELLQRPELRFCSERSVPAEIQPNDASQSLAELLDLDSLAAVLQWLAIALLAAALIWLLRRLQPGRWLERRRKGPNKPLPADRARALVEPTDKPLDRVSERAEAAWQAGERRAALSLLYRGALATLLPDGADSRARTEREVLKLLRQRQISDEVLATMQVLTRLWQQSAWAHRLPADDDFHVIHARWGRHFSRARGGFK